MWDAERTRDAEARFKRFEKFFRVQIQMWELVNTLLDQEAVKLRSGADRDLSLVVGASLGKALKTFQGVHELCLTGWSEDALVLLRSNVNLLISLGACRRNAPTSIWGGTKRRSSPESVGAPVFMRLDGDGSRWPVGP